MKRDNYWIFVLLAMLVGIVFFRQTLFQSGIMFGGELKASLHYWQWLRPLFHAWSQSGAYGFATTPYYISPGMPEIYAYSIPTMTPLFVLFGLVGSVFKGNGPVMVYVLSFPLQYLGWYYLLPHFGVNQNRSILAFIAFLVFVLNPYKTEGVIASGMVYGLNHGIWLLWLASAIGLLAGTVKRPQINYRSLAIFLILTWLSYTLAIGMMVITTYSALFLIGYYLVKERKDREAIRSILKLVLIATGWLLLVNSYFLLPNLLSHVSVLNNTDYSYPLPNELLNVILMTNGSHLAGQSNFWLWLIPIAAMIGLVLGDLKHRLWVISALLIGVVITVGLNAPFTGLNEWLYRVVPLFDYGRSAHRYLVLVLAAYSMGVVALFRLGLAWLKHNHHPESGVMSWLTVGLVLLVIVITNPKILSGTPRALAKITPPAKYEQLVDWVRTNQSASDPVLFLTPVGVVSSKVYPWLAESAYQSPFDSLYFMPADLIGGQVNTISPAARYSEFMLRQLKKDHELARLLIDKARLRTVIVDNEIQDQEFVARVHQILAGSNKYIEVSNGVAGFNIYQANAYSPAVAVKSFDLLVGDLNTLRSPAVNDQFIYLNDINNDPLNILAKCEGCRVIFDQTSVTDLAYLTAQRDGYEIVPVDSPLGEVIKQGGWSVMHDLYSYTVNYGLFTNGRYPVGTTIPSTIEYQLDLSKDKAAETSWVVLARINHQPNQLGKISFSYPGLVADTVASAEPEISFKVHEIGIITERDGSLKVSTVTEGGAIIDSIIAVPESIWQEYLAKLNNVLGTRTVVNDLASLLPLDADNEYPVLINGDTRFKYSIDLADTQFAYLNQSFNLDWNINQTKPIVANYFGTAYLGTSGTITAEYGLESPFKWGLLLTLLAWLGCLAMFVYENKNTEKTP